MEDAHGGGGHLEPLDGRGVDDFVGPLGEVGEGGDAEEGRGEACGVCVFGGEVGNVCAVSWEGEVEVATVDGHGLFVGPDWVRFGDVESGEGVESVEDGVVVESEAGDSGGPDIGGGGWVGDNHVGAGLLGELVDETELEEARFAGFKGLVEGGWGERGRGLGRGCEGARGGGVF